MESAINFGPVSDADLESLHSRIGTVFVGDNGRCTCWKHSGVSIRITGKDISGQEAITLSKEEAKDAGVKCESCAK